MSLLDDLLSASARRAASLVPSDLDRARAPRPSFLDALAGRDRVSLIAEIKRGSPSHGTFADERDVTDRARSYERAGASAISVLTEPTRFRGSYEDLRRVADVVRIPVLMKDFIVHERQIEAAARIGASAVLLIVRALSPRRLGDLLAHAGEHGLDALVECHDAAELSTAVDSGARIVGVNNRDLDTLSIDLSRAHELLRELPPDVVAVAESGYSDATEVQPLRGHADAVLIGGALMSTRDVEAEIRELLS